MNTHITQMIEEFDVTRKGDSSLDLIWHEIEIFSSLAGIYSFKDATLEEVIKAAQDRIEKLKSEDSVALKEFQIDIEDEQYTLSLIDALLSHIILIKNMFEEHIQKGEMSEDKRAIAEAQLDSIKKINELLKNAGLKQHLSQEELQGLNRDVIAGIGSQTVHYSEEEQ